jgi:ferredoxin--NADP+ reductase
MTDVQALRDQHYNATLVATIDLNKYLRCFRVRPDHGVFDFKPGQYITLGLGYWEPRVEGAPAEQLKEGQEQRLCRRAYSISHPVLDDATGDLVASEKLDCLEFYITLIDQANQPNLSPGLTPRLWLLRPGDRLHAGEKPTGHYSLDSVRDGDDVVLAATGTGEAPHNAMVWELLRRGHQGRLASVVGARYKADLGYRAQHEALARRYPRYRYFPLTTREPENAGRKMYLQHFIGEGHLERELGWSLDPERTHVFLCGNPAMIGIPRVVDGERRYPSPQGLVEVLEKRGFRADSRRDHFVGNVHFEEYW